MSENDNILEGTRVLSITDANGRHKEFISEVEKEVSGFKLKYYMWLSRLFILFAVVSLMIFMSSSLALFKLAPQVSVEPFLIIRQDTSDGIVRYEPISYKMASKNQLMETFVRQYVLLRNTIIADEKEMQTRWFPGGMMNFLSSDYVFGQFSAYRDSVWSKWFVRSKLFPSASSAAKKVRFGRWTSKPTTSRPPCATRIPGL